VGQQQQQQQQQQQKKQKKYIREYIDKYKPNAKEIPCTYFSRHPEQAMMLPTFSSSKMVPLWEYQSSLAYRI
jgi:hypothetical protein